MHTYVHTYFVFNIDEVIFSCDEHEYIAVLTVTIE